MGWRILTPKCPIAVNRYWLGLLWPVSSVLGTSAAAPRSGAMPVRRATAARGVETFAACRRCPFAYVTPSTPAAAFGDNARYWLDSPAFARPVPVMLGPDCYKKMTTSDYSGNRYWVQSVQLFSNVPR